MYDRANRLLNLIRDLLAELDTEVSRLALDAVTDPLTGVHNRRFFDLRLAQEVERIRRYGGQMALVVLDLDDFKEYNDRHGHRRGDEMLTAVAQILARDVREPDVVCRYGGEEFALILPETSEEGAIRLVLRLRDRMREHLGDQLTFSAGVALFPRDAKGSHELLDAADRALYQAKAAGKAAVATTRGQVVRFVGRGRSEEAPASPAAEGNGSELQAIVELLHSVAGRADEELAAEAARPEVPSGEAGSPPGPGAPAGPADPPQPEPRHHPPREPGGGGEAEAPAGIRVGVGFEPDGGAPQGVWLGTDFVRVQAAEPLAGGGYLIRTAYGRFAVRPAPDGWRLYPAPGEGGQA